MWSYTIPYAYRLAAIEQERAQAERERRAHENRLIAQLAEVFGPERIVVAAIELGKQGRVRR